MEVVNPSVMVSRLDLVALDSAAAGIDFHRLPKGFWNIGVFIEQKVGSGGNRGGHNPPGRAWASRCALVGCAPLKAPPQVLLRPIGCLLVQKIHKKFLCVWTPFGIDFLLCKKHAKKLQLALGTMSIG